MHSMNKSFQAFLSFPCRLAVPIKLILALLEKLAKLLQASTTAAAAAALGL